MSIVLPKEGGDFELAPAGSHLAVCYRLVDIGTQQTEWEGKIIRSRKIIISFEIPEEKMADGRPFTTHKRFNLSSSRKGNLRPFLESWRGAAFADADFGKFDLGVLLGKPCMLGIVHAPGKEGGTYENISSIMKLPKGMNVPPLTNELLYFSLNDFKQEVYEKLSDGLRATIAKSPEYAELFSPKVASVPPADSDNSAPAGAERFNDLDDTIPF